MSLTFDGLEPAVAEARAFAARLHREEYRGPGDTDEAVRNRLNRKTGVPASYFLRLHKRAREMTDVSGKYARLLRLAVEALDAHTARINSQTSEIENELETIRRRRAGRRGAAGSRPDQASLFQEP
ncbi:hypothetical protein GTW51_10165 [Aurantimonas aggregata]|uniref:Uncharacterized protein n=1 Tax=Aurantimonas aggregata TaxID=2047720 RepID=A0A6L9MHC2_9HYPH|nr:hypothetical protein [Aurantimonas aggregata]NDV87066.1 hypothetical protein [Aurantimonas aggregata]